MSSATPSAMSLLPHLQPLSRSSVVPCSLFPYEPGTLKAAGVNGDKEVATSVLQTGGNPVELRLIADRTVLEANGEDLSFVTVEAQDSEGHFQPNAKGEVKFALTGPGSIIAVRNGDGTSKESYQGDQYALFNGRALVVVRTSRAAGSIRLSAIEAGMKTDEITLSARTTSPSATLR